MSKEIFPDNEGVSSETITAKILFNYICTPVVAETDRNEMMENGIMTLGAYDYFFRVHCKLNAMSQVRKQDLYEPSKMLAMQLLETEERSKHDELIKADYEEGMDLWKHMQNYGTQNMQFCSTLMLFNVLDRLVEISASGIGSPATIEKTNAMIRKLWNNHVLADDCYRNWISFIRIELARYTGNYLRTLPELFGYEDCGLILSSTLCDNVNTVRRQSAAQVIRTVRLWRNSTKNHRSSIKCTIAFKPPFEVDGEETTRTLFISSGFTADQRGLLLEWYPYLEYLQTHGTEQKLRQNCQGSIEMFRQITEEEELAAKNKPKRKYTRRATSTVS